MPERHRAEAALEWRDVGVRCGAFALAGVSLRLETGEWLAVTGPTGAGKTLLLEIAAGFLDPACGAVLRRGQEVTHLPPELRRLGYVPQDDLLFPHLDVRRNVAFGAGGRSDLEPELLGAARDLGITHLLDRRPAGLSGGEAQRIALARAYLGGADVLLLDECTSALDAPTRRRVGDVVAAWRRARNLSIVQVTHDEDEARRLADRWVGLDAGRLVFARAARRDGQPHIRSLRPHSRGRRR